MGALLNRRRYMGASKQAKTLFEMYNQYFDGTVNSVVDTGLKLWDGTHNRWKMEVVYQRITAINSNITLFAVRPDASPYSGIRVRQRSSYSFDLTISDTWEIIENPGDFYIYQIATYGNALDKTSSLEYDTFTLIRDGQYLYCDYNGQTATLRITDPKTNNLNLLIGCDYKGANNKTQRYYTGTIQKFVISGLEDSLYDAEIEYLEGTGTQWIDTGVSISNGIFAEYYGAFATGSPIVSTDTTTVAQLFRVMINGYNIWPWKGGAGELIRISPDANVFYNIGHDTRNLSHKLYWNGDLILDEDTTFTLTNPYHICIFHDAGNIVKGKIRTFKLTDSNDNVVLDWKAVRVGQVGYMYDSITGELHGNDGTGDFVLGPDKT